MTYQFLSSSLSRFVDIKQKDIARSLFIPFFIFMLFGFDGCATFRTYEVSDNFSKQKIQRVGLLVSRVGNVTAGTP